jgi:DNA-binding NtrC family response regulator
MEYAWIVSGGQPITVEHLPHEMRNPSIAGRTPTPASLMPPLPGDAQTHLPPVPGATTLPFPGGMFPGLPGVPSAGLIAPGNPAGKSLADVEMEYILQVYAKNNLNKQATATELGISLKTLYNKLHKYEEERRMRAG